MEINDLMSKIDNYSTCSNYTPLKIIFHIRPPLYLANPWINLDGILSYLCLRDALGEDYWSLLSNEKLDISNLDIPLKKTKDVYHSSVGIYKDPRLVKNTIYKRFTDKESHHLTKRLQKGKIRTNAGHFKDFMLNLPLVITDTITFYCNGDKKEIERLLKNLHGLGKKTSIGGGTIISIDILEIDNDYSFYKEGKIMKQIPSTIELPVLEGSTWIQCSYKPPYWDKSQVTMCRVPENQLLKGVK